MMNPQAVEGSTAIDVSGETSESTLHLNVKTLDSRTYSFNVDKNIHIAAFKENIASQCGVPVGQQRLIFRGKVLKDDQFLSDYNVESGDTLHLVERQQLPASGSSTGQAASQGQGLNTGVSVNHIGSIGQSVLLGTVNAGDLGESVVPDLSRVIGAVLNTVGIDNQAGVMQAGAQASQGNQVEGLRANARNHSQYGNQSTLWQPFAGQAAPQIPLGAAIPVPLLNATIPDSLNTQLEFINQMMLAFSRSGDQPEQSTTANLPSIEIPSNSRGLPTVEGVSIVLQHAHRLLGDHAVPALSHAAGSLNQVGDSSDPALRGQVHAESLHLGMIMQHLGALLLELGRTLLGFRTRQSPAESSVNAGPAVYISRSGPNLIMVQPSPLQTSSLFGGTSGSSPSPVATGSVAVSGIPRNVNIHIHTGASLAPVVSTGDTRAPTGDGMRAENINAIGVPPQPAIVSMPGAVPSGISVPLPPGSGSVSSIVAEMNAHLRSLVPNMQNRSQASSSQAEVSTDQEQHVGYDSRADTSGCRTRAGETNVALLHGSAMDDQEQTSGRKSDTKETRDVSSSSKPSMDFEEGSHDKLNASNQDSANHDGQSVPLGLGLRGLQPKKQGRQLSTQARDGDDSGASSQNQQSRAVGHEVLQSLESLSTRGNLSPQPLGHPQDVTRGSGRSVPAARQNMNGQGDVADEMSQILQNPSVDCLLAGVSQQTVVGSPDMLRNMLLQFTQNPALRNTVNQIAQQVDSHDLGSMFSGLDRGPGGGVDLSTMMQQMMPIVSQALGGFSSVSQQTPSEPMGGSMPRQQRVALNNHPQIDIQQVVQSLENQSSSEEIFHSLVNVAVNLSINSSAGESFVIELCSECGLAQEFMEMFYDDVSQRFQDEE